jgi:heme/copper-type cytochrome/quinol oxidase subunit 4
MMVLLDDNIQTQELTSHVGNLIFMCVILLLMLLAAIWWLRRNS